MRMRMCHAQQCSADRARAGLAWRFIPHFPGEMGKVARVRKYRSERRGKRRFYGNQFKKPQLDICVYSAKKRLCSSIDTVYIIYGSRKSPGKAGASAPSTSLLRLTRNSDPQCKL